MLLRHPNDGHGVWNSVKVWPRNENLGVEFPYGEQKRSEGRRGPRAGPGGAPLFVIFWAQAQECG